MTVTFVDNSAQQYDSSAVELTEHLRSLGLGLGAMRVWLGDRNSSSMVQLRHREITHAINCERDLFGCSKEEGVIYLNRDAEEEGFDDANTFLIELLSSGSASSRVLVFDLTGNGRSCGVLLSLLMCQLKMTLAQAYRALSMHRSSMNLRSALVEQLRKCEASINGGLPCTLTLSRTRQVLLHEKFVVSWTSFSPQQRVKLSLDLGGSSPVVFYALHGAEDEAMEQVRRMLLELQVEVLPCVVDLTTRQVEPLREADPSEGEGEESPEKAASPEELCLQALGLYEECYFTRAAALYCKALEREPCNASARFNAASLCHMLGLPSLAVHHTMELLLRNAGDATAHSFLWALAQTDAPRLRPVVTSAYRRLAASGDASAAHKLSVLTGEGESARRVDPAYARAIYDDMGGAFESKLVDHLGYRGPWQLLSLLQETLGEGLRAEGWRVLDLGCGSGLCGRVFESLVSEHEARLSAIEGGETDAATVATGSVSASALSDLSCLCSVLKKPSFMAGADVSMKMVEISAKSGKYHALGCCDLHDALRVFQGAELDLVLAADTFIYVGALGRTFAAVRRALKRGCGGLFAFSTEDLDESPMRLPSPPPHCADTLNDEDDDEDDIPGAVPGWGAALLSSARFAHSGAYVERLAEQHGFRLVGRRQVVLRCEATVPLAGQLFLLEAIETAEG